MKKILVIVALAIVNFSFSQNGSFEIKQVVQDFTKGENVQYNVVWKVNGSQAVMEFDYSGTGNSNVVFLSQNNALYLYSKNTNTDKKHYYKAVVNNKENFQVFATKNTTNINGYLATKYIMKSREKEVEFWFTEAIDIDFKSVANIFNGTDFEGIAKDLPTRGFIMEYTIKLNGETQTIVNFNSIVVASFSPQVFEFPAGYTLGNAIK